jgi:hypothetical protein
MTETVNRLANIIQKTSDSTTEFNYKQNALIERLHGPTSFASTSVILPVPNSKSIIRYDLITKNSAQYEIVNLPFSFNVAFRKKWNDLPYVFLADTTIFVFGGRKATSNDGISEWFSFDMSEGAYAIPLANMNHSRCLHCGYRVGRIVFAFGGWRNATAEKYLIDTDQWWMIKKFPFRENALCYTVELFNGNLFLTAKNTRRIAKFAPETETYSILNYRLP